MNLFPCLFHIILPKKPTEKVFCNSVYCSMFRVKENSLTASILVLMATPFFIFTICFKYEVDMVVLML